MKLLWMIGSWRTMMMMLLAALLAALLAVMAGLGPD
jgi:hypothetical protein